MQTQKRRKTGRGYAGDGGLSIQTEGGCAGFRGENKHKDMMWSHGGDVKEGVQTHEEGVQTHKEGL